MVVQEIPRSSALTQSSGLTRAQRDPRRACFGSVRFQPPGVFPIRPGFSPGSRAGATQGGPQDRRQKLHPMREVEGPVHSVARPDNTAFLRPLCRFWVALGAVRRCDTPSSVGAAVPYPTSEEPPPPMHRAPPTPPHRCRRGPRVSPGAPWRVALAEHPPCWWVGICWGVR